MGSLEEFFHSINYNYMKARLPQLYQTILSVGDKIILLEHREFEAHVKQVQDALINARKQNWKVDLAKSIFFRHLVAETGYFERPNSEQQQNKGQ